MEKITIPSEETRKQTLIALRETNHRLDALGLLIDDLLGMIDEELRCQRRKKWQQKDLQFSQNLKNLD